ncbi:MAG: Dabb family protein [Marinilabilia sp.]
MKTRRSFIKKLSAGSLLTAMTVFPLKASEKNKTISDVLIHHVFFWLKNPESKADRKQFEEAIRKLTTIEQIRESHFGVPAPTEERDVVDHSYTYSLMLIFNNKEDQDKYQVHPDHKEFVDKNEHLWEKVAVYDSVDV